jgi:acetyl-CoA decarbonylase/synthase complex subunit delta
MPGADFLAVYLEGAHPDKSDKTPEECAALVKEIADAVDFPVAVIGCNNIEKDAKIFEKVAEAVYGKNVLILSAREENYKTIAAAAGLAYEQKVGAESAVDINLAKQLNVLISQMGLKPENMAMDIGSAAAGYGFEYIVSTIDRVKLAALAQSDAMLQMPIVTPVFSEAWSVKESIADEADYPEWGSAESRGVNMEVATAAACLAAGSNAVILMHPDSVAIISTLINALI